MNWGVWQWVAASVVGVMLIAPPVVRTLMIAAGAKGFKPWAEWVGFHIGRNIPLMILTVAVFLGGFWNHA